jgi:hypothetical protein
MGKRCRCGRLAPGNFEVHMYLGVYLGMAGQHVEGLRELNRAAEFKPDSAHVRYNLGITLKLAGRLEEAAQQLEAALKLDPNYQKAASALEAVRALVRSEPTRDVAEQPDVTITRLGEEQLAPAPGPPQAAARADNQCPSCGALVSPGAFECSLCRKPLRPTAEPSAELRPTTTVEALHPAELPTAQRVPWGLWIGALNGIFFMLALHLMERYVFKFAEAVVVPWSAALLGIVVRGVLIGGMAGIAAALTLNVWVAVGAAAIAVVLINAGLLLIEGGFQMLRAVGGGISPLVLFGGIIFGAITGWVAGETVIKSLAKAQAKPTKEKK